MVNMRWARSQFLFVMYFIFIHTRFKSIDIDLSVYKILEPRISISCMEKWVLRLDTRCAYPVFHIQFDSEVKSTKYLTWCKIRASDIQLHTVKLEANCNIVWKRFIIIITIAVHCWT